MTNEQAKAIYKAIFTAFPSFREYLETKVEDGDATFAEWCDMLGGVNYDHATEAVALMKTGERKVPEAYERDRLPLWIRAYAGFIGDQQAKQEADRRLQQESQRRHRERSCSQWRHNLGTILDEAREAGRRLRDGEITEAENKRIIDELRAKARETKRSAVETETIT